MRQGRVGLGSVLLVAGLLLALSGCTDARIVSPAVTSRAAHVTASASVTTSPAPLPSPVPTFPDAPKPAAAASAASIRHAFGSGCAATSARMPATRFTASIGDVDGDGRRDTEWATIPGSGMLEFGVTTASGVTVSKTVGFASGGDRSVSIATLATGQTVALPTDGHAALVYVLHDCRWIEPRTSSSTSGTDLMTAYYDPPEAGGGCIGGRLYQVDSNEPSNDHLTITGVAEHLAFDGRRMTTGKQVTFVRDLHDDSASDPVQQYGDGLCAPSKRLRPEYRG